MARRGGDSLYLKVIFSKTVKLVEQNGKAIAVDENENNVAFGSTVHTDNKEAGGRAIRTAYFLKHRRLQSKPRLNERPLLAKFRGGSGGGLKPSSIRSPTK